MAHKRQRASGVEIVGVVSLLLWTLTVIVSLKYVVLMLQADNNGEGGTLSLLALAQRALGRHAFLLTIGVLGASLLYGDAVITPAISVLSAVEGLKLVTACFEDWVLPITSAILIGLFAVQAGFPARSLTEPWRSGIQAQLV